MPVAVAACTSLPSPLLAPQYVHASGGSNPEQVAQDLASSRARLLQLGFVHPANFVDEDGVMGPDEEDAYRCAVGRERVMGGRKEGSRGGM